jgi:hypothetical protein
MNYPNRIQTWKIDKVLVELFLKIWQNPFFFLTILRLTDILIAMVVVEPPKILSRKVIFGIEQRRVHRTKLVCNDPWFRTAFGRACVWK